MGGEKYRRGQGSMRKHGLLIGWPMRDSAQHRFAIPNKIWDHKLKPIAFVIFSYLCTIAAATGASKNTALKSICVLLEAGLITVEPSSYFDKRGMKWKGNNLYTILPIHSAVGIFHQRQLRSLELDVARSRFAAQTAV